MSPLLQFMPQSRVQQEVAVSTCHESLEALATQARVHPGTHGDCTMQVATLNHYAFLPDRPLGEATFDLRSLSKSGDVIDLQLRDVNDRERPLMASVTFHVQLQ